MKSLHKILKISAKQAFKTLRKHGPYYSSSLQSNVFITTAFWNHINFSKYRRILEVIHRLAIIPLIEQILIKGIIAEVRKKNNKIFNQISLQIVDKIFSVITVYNEQEKQHVLLSCFIDTQKK